MRVISTRAHGVMDYIMSVILVASPWLFGFAAGGVETWLPVILGAAAFIMSLLTNYELGVVPAIPMRTHLAMDAVSGVLLAVSPWLFGFSEYVWIPHLVLGLLEISASLTTVKTPSLRRTSSGESGRPVVDRTWWICV